MSASDAREPDSLLLQLEGFEGPLDLLLDLARTQKVDLAKISILSLVEQYLAVIEGARRIRLELAADWLVMAAWLTWLKSRLLLPEGSEAAEEAEVAADILAARLRDLQAIRAGAVWLAARPQLGQDVFARGAPEDHTEIDRSRLALDLGSLVRAYLFAVRRGAGTRRYQPRPLTLWSVKDALQSPRRTARQRARLDQPRPLPARYAGRPAGAPRRPCQHAAGRPGNGTRRRGAAAAGTGFRPDPAAHAGELAQGAEEERMTDEPSAALIAPDEEALRLAEALVFASAGPVGARALSQLLPGERRRRCGDRRACASAMPAAGWNWSRPVAACSSAPRRIFRCGCAR